jgi:hypothetical protein
MVEIPTFLRLGQAVGVFGAKAYSADIEAAIEAEQQTEDAGIGDAEGDTRARAEGQPLVEVAVEDSQRIGILWVLDWLFRRVFHGRRKAELMNLDERVALKFEA